MNTCKATLRVLFAHRVYLMIYLVFIGILMMSISWAMLTSASGSMSAVLESTKTRVAIIDRDSDRGDIATSCAPTCAIPANWWTSTTPAKRCNRPVARTGWT